MKLSRIAPLICLSVVAAAAGIAAQTGGELDYDIYSADSSLYVWINLSPCLIDSDVDQLKDGLDVLFQCRVRLLSPKSILPDRKIAESVDMVRLGFRPVTEDYFLERGDSALTRQYSFVSLGGLREYLTDSVEIRVFEQDSLDQTGRYVVDLAVQAIVLSDLNLARVKGKRGETDGSPVQFLFRKFLNLTGYGSREYRTKSRSFSPDETELQP